MAVKLLQEEHTIFLIPSRYAISLVRRWAKCGAVAFKSGHGH